MKDPHPVDPHENPARRTMRVVGPALIGVGGLLLMVGAVDFFSAFGTFRPPKLFWCLMLGLLVLGIGLMLTQVAYVRSFLRYFAQETTPVAKDTFNELAEGTRPGVRTFSQAMGEGFAAGAAAGGQVTPEQACPRCHAPNPGSHKYCSQCGSVLGSATCPGCGASLPAEVAFCGQCGAKVE